MGPWVFILAGLLVWAVHFTGVYAIASVADVGGRADAPLALGSTVALTLACAAVDGAILWAAHRRWRAGLDATERFLASLAGLGGSVSLLAVLWQGLPALVGH